jgi:hypothetical protein
VIAAYVTLYYVSSGTTYADALVLYAPRLACSRKPVGIRIAEALYYRYCMAEVVGDDDMPLWIP